MLTIFIKVRKCIDGLRISDLPSEVAGQFALMIASYSYSYYYHRKLWGRDMLRAYLGICLGYLWIFQRYLRGKVGLLYMYFGDIFEILWIFWEFLKFLGEYLGYSCDVMWTFYGYSGNFRGIWWSFKDILGISWRYSKKYLFGIS